MTATNLRGSGADPTGRTRMSFARYKGEAENALLARGFVSVYIFRPACIYPVTPRREPNLGYRLLRAIYLAFRLMFPYQVIRAGDLARAMVDVAVRGAELRRGVHFRAPRHPSHCRIAPARNTRPAVPPRNSLQDCLVHPSLLPKKKAGIQKTGEIVVSATNWVSEAN
jgi:hypothetical protein